MNVRHAGWIGHRLKRQLKKFTPESFADVNTLNGLKTVGGLEKRLIRAMLTLCEYRRSISFGSKLGANPLFVGNARFAVKPTLPIRYDAYVIKNLHLVRSLVARSYKALRMAKRRPVHGQRRWHNANMARRCSRFFSDAVRAFETDLYRFRLKSKFKWSKQWEMRQKAKMRTKKKKKKWTKFKKFGERRLAIKKQKKTPWD